MSRIILAALTLTLSWAAAFAIPVRKPYGEQQPLLRLKFVKGQDFYVEIATKSTQAIKFMGQDIKQQQEQTFVYLVAPEEPTRVGDFKVRLRLAGVRMDTDLAGNRMTYDSSKPDGPMAAMFGAMFKQDLHLTIKPDGTIARVEGTDALVKNIADPALNGLLANVLNESAVRLMFAPVIDVLPNAPVSPGLAWSRTWTADVAGIAFTNQNRIMYVGAVGPLHQFATTTSIALEKSKNPAAGLAVVKSIDLKSNQGTGTLVFNAELGRLQEFNQTTRLTGKMTLDLDNHTIDMDQTQVTRIRTHAVHPWQQR